MTAIDPKEWSFRVIHLSDIARAGRLEAAGSPSELVSALALALKEAVKKGNVCFAVDSRSNEFVECRSIVQFRVPTSLYDWFFNARTGYRAQYWIGQNEGIEFNSTVVRSLASVLNETLSVQQVTVRRIAVDVANGCREERDVGATAIARRDFLASLEPEVAKIWLCEWQHAADSSSSKPTGLAVLSAAARSAEKLQIPRWEAAVNPTTGEKGEGLRAPVDSWLDVKGGFLSSTGTLTQIKPQTDRACQIHTCGWTYPR